MSQGVAQPSGHEPWAIRVPGDEAVRKPGENLREWAGDERGTVRRFLDRVTFRDERDPKLAGAWGEEVVGRELAKLDGDWSVVHGVRLGPKADVDHLVVGPAGVFSINTKRIAFEKRVRVSARRFLVDGYSRDYYPKAVDEAGRVAERLRKATGLDVVVHPVLVMTGVDRRKVEILEQPADLTVVLRRDLCGWLKRRSRVLGPDAARQLADAVRRPSTWDPSKVPMILDRPPPPPATARRVEVVEWRRYGHHRRYVNDVETGQGLGWRDERTGRVHVEDGIDPSLVREALGVPDRD